MKDVILKANEIHETRRDEKLWTGLWHATIPKEFIIVASHEKFSGSVWTVYAYITSRMDLKSGRSRRLKENEICEALGISQWTLHRAIATLKEYAFIETHDDGGTVYSAPDIAAVTERAKERRIRKNKESKLQKHEDFLEQKETELGIKFHMRKREQLIKEEFGEKYHPIIL